MISLSVIYPDVGFFKLPIMEADCYTYLHVSEGFSLDTFPDKFKSLVIACLTASYHCIRVAIANPVDSLRYE